MSKKDYREEKNFTKSTRKRTICYSCGAKCLYIGLKNSRGQYKEYCCDCYSKLDNYFDRSLWCKTCNMVSLKNIKMRNLEKQYVPINYVVELLQKNCNYSPKMCFIEITNMLTFSKRRKDLK